MALALQLAGLLIVLVTTQSVPIGNDVCVVDGQVYANGATFVLENDDTPCVQYKCHNGGHKIHEKECPDNEGNCHPRGTKETSNCIERECKKGDSGTIFYVQKAQCVDVNQKCHEPGTIFSSRINDVLYHNCTCKLDGDRPVYSC